MSKLKMPDDGLETKQYAVVGLTEQSFMYSQFDDRDKAEEYQAELREILELAFDSGNPASVRIVFCEILHIVALDRVMVDEILEDSEPEL